MRYAAVALRRLITPLLALLIYSHACWAQADPWEQVKTIRQGRNVAVKLHTGKSVKGKMDAWRIDGLSVEKGNQLVSIAKQDIVQVALVIGKTRARKALIAGLITGGAVAGIMVAGCATQDCETPAVVPIGAAFWGGAAAGIAALFPPHLEVIYSASPPRTN